MSLSSRCYLRLATAYVRGKLRDQFAEDPRFVQPLDKLTEEKMASLFEVGKLHEL